MTINERLKILIKDLYSNNKSSFSKAVGVSPTVIENIVGSRSGNPSFNVIQKILSANANINALWLINGTGKMLIDDNLEYATINKADLQPDQCPNCKIKDEKIKDLQYIISLQSDLIQELKEKRDHAQGDAECAAVG